MGGLRIGLIGANSDAGWASGTHLPAIAALDGVSLVAACTTRKESARKTADLYGAAHALTDPAQLVALPDVDLVVVSVRAPGHAALVELALQAGKPVLCEWPLGASAEQSARLTALAAEKGLPNFVCLQGFASPAALAARDKVETGAIGDVLSVRMAGTFRPWGGEVPQSGIYLTDVNSGVSVASIIGGHSLHMMESIAGGWSAFQGAAANRWTRIRIAETGEEIAQTSPDQFVVSGVLESGALASLHLSGGVAGPEQCEMMVHGKAGSLRLGMPTVPEIMPPSLEMARNGSAFEPLAIDDRFRLAPASLERGPAYNVAQLYALILQDLATGSRRAPDFASASRLRTRIAGIAH